MANDDSACKHVPEALCVAAETDGENGDGSAGNTDVKQAEYPSQQAFPEGEPLTVKSDNLQMEEGFPGSLSMEKAFANEMISQQGKIHEIRIP